MMTARSDWSTKRQIYQISVAYKATTASANINLLAKKWAGCRKTLDPRLILRSWYSTPNRYSILSDLRFLKFLAV